MMVTLKLLTVTRLFSCVSQKRSHVKVSDNSDKKAFKASKAFKTSTELFFNKLYSIKLH